MTRRVHGPFNYQSQVEPRLLIKLIHFTSLYSYGLLHEYGLSTPCNDICRVALKYQANICCCVPVIASRFLHKSRYLKWGSSTQRDASRSYREYHLASADFCRRRSAVGPDWATKSIMETASFTSRSEACAFLPREPGVTVDIC